MVPSIEGEFARKRRMMSHGWPIVLRGGMLSPRGYDPLYALMIFSHRVLRYLSPFLHVVALGDQHRAPRATAGFTGSRSRCRSRCCSRRRSPARYRARPLLIARYYVLTTASLAAGLWDWLGARNAGGLGTGRGDAVISSAARPDRSGSRARSSRRRWSRVLALAVRLESPGDPIYRQKRIGKNGRPFEIYKLRTMVSGAEFSGAGLAIAEGDDRITRIGALLRRYSLDELPNLWNVVRGEMAIVGPRPTLESQVLAVHAAPARPARGPARHHRLGPGQRARVAAVAGADRARPLVRRASFVGARPDDPAPNGRHGRARPRDLQGSDGRMAGPDQRDVAVLLTGVGKRYDIVSAFAQHATVIAADPEPAGAGAVRRPPPPRRCRGSTTPATCRRSQALCSSSASERWCR